MGPNESYELSFTGTSGDLGTVTDTFTVYNIEQYSGVYDTLSSLPEFEKYVPSPVETK